MNSIRIAGTFLLLTAVASVTYAAASIIPACTEDGLTKLLSEKVMQGEGANLQDKTWWTRCALDVRKAVWQSFLLPKKDDGSAKWQLPTGDPLPVLRTAPDFKDTGNWINSDPLTMSQLRGKVVLIHFWTLGCINCIHTLPSIKGYAEKYKDENFTVIGVHSPEFAYEKSLQNLKAAIKQRGLTYPNVQDNDFGTWNAYGNRYWPAIYLVDAEGKVRYTHFGEGAYEETDRAIAALIAESK